MKDHKQEFKHNESVVIDTKAFSASGKVVNKIEDADGYYTCAFVCNGGWECGIFHESQLTSFGDDLFLATEPYPNE